MATPEERDAARAWLAENLGLDPAEITAAIGALLADGWLAGAHAAASGGLQVNAAIATVDAQTDWSTWRPGDIKTAQLLDDGGFQRLLDDAGVTIQGIVDTTYDRLGTMLADGIASGDSIDSIAGDLFDVLGDPERAFQIADTEVARAMTASSIDSYTENGVVLFDWLDSPDACPECVELAGGGPYTVGTDDTPPAHPSCRCSVSPVLSSIDGAAEQTEADQLEADVGEG